MGTLKLDKNGMKTAITNIDGYASNISSSMKKMSQALTGIKNSWSGQLYNTALVTPYNKIVPEVNKLLETLVKGISENLSTDFYNYTLWDEGTGQKVALSATVTKVDTLEKCTDTNLVNYDPATTLSLVESAKTETGHVVEYANKIVAAIKGFTWESDNSGEIKTTLTNCASNVAKSIDELSAALKTVINTVSGNQSKVESANTGKK